MKKLLLTLATIFVSSLVMGQTPTENYILSTTFQTETPTGSVTDDEKIESVIYFDGLGRPMQSIGIRAGGNSEDVITHIEYDAFGRQGKDYLPYATTTNNGLYRINALSVTNAYYLSKHPNDINSTAPNPYSEKLFEDSPLNRIEFQGAPGKDWKANNTYYDHSIQFNYQTNTAIEVLKFEISITESIINNVVTFVPTLNLDTSSANNNGYYNANELYKTITYDENHTYGSGKNHSTEEFKDKQGRVILKRTYNNNLPHDTYYVYDDYGNLTYVLPPKASELGNLVATLPYSGTVESSANLALEATEAIVLTNFHAKPGSNFTAKIVSVPLNELCYQYKYDDRNRLVEKKIPGKGWEYIVYDKLDRPMLTQDANLRASNQWLFTKYDVFGRVVYTGLHTNAVQTTRTAIQTHVLAQNNLDTEQYETKVTSGTGHENSYYTNNNYPKTSIVLHTINYYDNYTFDGFTNMPSSIEGRPLINHNNSSGTQKLTKGLATGSKVRVLDSSNPAKWITTTSGYDKKGRPIYVKTVNDYLQTTDIVKSKLDFAGKVEKTTTTHSKTGQTDDIITQDVFVYDHEGRLLRQKQTINNLAQETLFDNTYDDLGQLKSKGVGGKSSNPARLQNVDYAYNVRGWLKEINNTVSLGNDLFGFKINYNTVDHNGTKLYNGNISETEWKTKNQDQGLKWYTFSYDALNRITSAINTVNTNYNLSSVTYDKNGNIISLERRGHIVENPVSTNSGHFDVMDQLSYTYQANSNKLLSVTDAIITPVLVKGEFKDGNNSGNDYIYEANGNLTSDLNKSITNIEYNHLNLPTQVTIDDVGANEGSIIYVYDATGNKQKKIVTIVSTNSVNTTFTSYAGNYIYENSNGYLTCSGCPSIPPSPIWLKFFNHSEGYVEPKNENDLSLGFNYVYQYKDHLGNVRLTYADSDNNGSIDASTEIISEKNYYPFGLEHKGYNNVVNGTENKYQTYQGQEKEEELGKNTYAFQWRDYDPAIGRFNKIDRFAEKYASHSPYGFTKNNPIRFLEVKGDSLWIAFGKDNANRVLYQDGKLLNKDGSQYTGKGVKVKKDGSIKIRNSFLKSSVRALDKIAKAEGETGTNVVSTLQGSDNNFTLAQGWNHFDPGEFGKPGIYMNEATYVQGQNTGKGAIGGTGPSDTRGTGGIIYWNPSSQVTTTTTRGTRTANTGVTLGHELFHAYDANSGNLVRSQYGGSEVGEIRASFFGNQLRSTTTFGIKHYRTQYNDGGYNLLDATGNPRTVTPTIIWDNKN